MKMKMEAFSFQTESSMGGSLGGRELDEQVEKNVKLGENVDNIFWASGGFLGFCPQLPACKIGQREARCQGAVSEES